MDGTCSTHEREMTNSSTTLVGKPEGKRPVRRPKRKWEDDIKSDF
jgi:hypothetical protein